ncbi:hypothetical protein Hanom_Chr10g00903901 [Helianthus anomalus]
MLPKDSLLLFQYEGNLTFRMICFYQDLAFPRGDFLYCKTSQFSEHKDYFYLLFFN